MDSVFQALAHEDRRRILDLVKDAPGCTVGSVCSNFSTSRIAVLKHIKVLEDAGLIVRRRDEKDARTKRLHVNTAPIQMIYDRWTTEFSRVWAPRITQLKYAIERGEQDPASDTSGDPPDDTPVS